MNPAPNASESVAGRSCLTSCSTLMFWVKEYALPVKMFFIVLTYWT